LKKLSEIERYKNVRFFVKFTNPEFVDSLLDGNLYMNTLGYFIDLEKETKIKGQGDQYEGAHVFGLQNIKLIDNETNTVIGTAKGGMVQERYKGTRDIPIFCFTLFSAKDFKVIEEGDGTVSFTLSIGDEETQKIIENFGSKVILLPGDFLEILVEDAEEQGCDYFLKSVSYVDYSIGIDSKRKEAFEDKSSEIVCWKDYFFNYQREVRFTIFDNLTKHPITFKMRNLRKDAVVMDTEKFLKDYYIKLELKNDKPSRGL
jgi:hypothetical protein